MRITGWCWYHKVDKFLTNLKNCLWEAGVVGDGGGSTPTFWPLFWGLKLFSRLLLASAFFPRLIICPWSLVWGHHIKWNKCAGVLNCAPQLQSDCHKTHPCKKTTTLWIGHYQYMWMKENNRALTGANKCFEPEYLQKTLVQEKEKKL